MDNFPSVKVIEVCKVSPPPPEEDSSEASPPTSLPLTFFDLLWLRFHPVERLFFYELPCSNKDDAMISFVDDVVPKLKASLSVALGCYLPLAGNLVWTEDIPTVEYVAGVDGVMLTVAESDADFNHLSGNGFRDESEICPLVPCLPVSHNRAAAIALQVTTFKNRGFCIGISNHHAIIDGRISTSFIKLWAQICKEGSLNINPKEMSFYDRSVINDPSNLSENYANAWQDKNDKNKKNLNLKLLKTQSASLIRCTLELTHKNLQNLKQRILNNENHISSFAVVIAYLCVCTTKLQGLEDGKFRIRFAADVRFRLKPTVPLNYFGNCLVGVSVCVERSELLGENGMVVAVEEISKGIRNLDEGPLRGAEEWGLILGGLGNYNSTDKSMSVAGSPRFNTYSVDFGWGKPVKVEITSASQLTFCFCLTDSRKTDVEMEIGVVMERSEMKRFVAIFDEGFQCL